MPDTATLWDLVSDERIAIEAVGRAVDAYLAEPATRTHALDRIMARPTIAMTPPTASSRSGDPTRRRRR